MTYPPFREEKTPPDLFGEISHTVQSNFQIRDREREPT